ncbi:ATP-binding protein [Schleiferilactobacillus harbinensis]|uniref:ATP-binding protein n=1 Tax=Schleiferilactobacillus harbinensis TaxID=304207 RepID=UPI003867DB65
MLSNGSVSEPRDRGSGLGLAIADWIVTNHHGHIRVTDIHPQGAAFVVTLPLSGK